MGLQGNALLLQRIVTVSIYKLFRFIFVVIQRINWQFTGTAQKLREARDPSNYERCAQVLDIFMLHKFCPCQMLSVNDFVLTHNRFENPQYIIDNEHISLIEITDENAVFCEAAEKGMHLWRVKYSPFIRLAQMEFGRRLIIVPLSALHRMAETIGDPKGEIIFLFNTARCGSTLFNQVMESTERCIAISEPDALNIVAFKYRTRGDSPEMRQLARDVMRWVMRPYPSIQPQPLAYAVKVSAPSAIAVPLFRGIYPASRCLFMYRDTTTVVKSLYRMSFPLPSLRLGYLLGKLSGFFTEAVVNSMSYSGKDYRIRLENDFMLGLLTAGLTTKTYLDMRKEGCDVKALRYEDLIAEPLETCRRIMEYCGLPVSLAEKGVTGLKMDSQRNSPIAKSIIGGHKEPEITPEVHASLVPLLKKFGMKPLLEEEIFEGTLGREN